MGFSNLIKKIFILIIIPISILFSLYSFFLIDFEYNNLLSLIFERISNQEAYLSGGSRFRFWSEYVSSFIPLPFGGGHRLLTDSSLFPLHRAPHNDFLRILYGYGYLFTIIFLNWLFKSSSRMPILLLVVFTTMFINTFIDDYKLFPLFLMILGMRLGYANRVKICTRNS